MIVGERGADLIKGNGCNLVCPDGVVDVELGIAGDFIVSPDENRLTDRHGKRGLPYLPEGTARR